MSPSRTTRSSRPAADTDREGCGREEERQGTAVERRALRSRYLAVKNLISDAKEDITRVDSDNFKSVIAEVENLHRLVQKPREQVADAEALLDIASTLVTSVRSQSDQGVTPSDFVIALLRNYGQQNVGTSSNNSQSMLNWAALGHEASQVVRNAPACCTMIGPMHAELKQRKVVVQRKRTRPTESNRPEELADSGNEAKTDTDKNMSTMFEILKRKRSVRLENLVLNHKSFAQTVENIFALSFLVKDGRAEMTVEDNGRHFVSPKNAPTATAIASGQVSYSHFVFRFDFKDWKLMMETVAVGDELMPDRTRKITESALPKTPIKKLTRNRGLVVHEESVVDDSPDRDSTSGKRKSRRLL